MVPNWPHDIKYIVYKNQIIKVTLSCLVSVVAQGTVHFEQRFSKVNISKYRLPSPLLEIRALGIELKMYSGNTFWWWSIDTELDFDCVGR